MFRLYDQSQCRGVAVVWRQGDAEPEKDKGEEDLELGHGEVLAEARPRPDAEGEVRLRELASAKDPPGKSLRVELQHVRPPDAGIVMQRRRLHEDADALGDANAAELHLLHRLSRHVCARGVQPQRLLDHHGQLQPSKTTLTLETMEERSVAVVSRVNAARLPSSSFGGSWRSVDGGHRPPPPRREREPATVGGERAA